MSEVPSLTSSRGVVLALPWLPDKVTSWTDGPGSPGGEVSGLSFVPDMPLLAKFYLCQART